MLRQTFGIGEVRSFSHSGTNGTPEAVSLAVPELGAGSCASKAPRVVIPKRKYPGEDFSQ